MDDPRPPGPTTTNATGSIEINLDAAPVDLGPYDVYSREPPEHPRPTITIDASVPDTLVSAFFGAGRHLPMGYRHVFEVDPALRDRISEAFGCTPRARGPAHPLASRPGSRAVAYSVQLWASACRRNAREGRHPDDDGTVYYCGAWVSREHLRADQRRPWVDRQDPAPGYAPSLGSLMVRPDPPPDPFVGRLVHDHPRERRNARAAERFAAWVAEMEQSSASSNFGLSLGQYEAVRGGRRTVIIAAGPWPETMHVSRELLEHGSLPGFRHDHPTLTIACHRRGAVYEMSYEDQAAMTVCFRLASYWSLERLPGFAEHARAEAAWRGAQG